MGTNLDIRPSSLAGQWYPADPGRLAQKIDTYLNQAEVPDLPGDLVAIVAPHAGILYSGPVAGYAFAVLRQLTPSLVAIVAPMHHLYFEPLLTTAHAAYATPLGVVPVHTQALDLLDQFLLEELGFGLSRVAYDQEHSLEIELPYLQRALSSPFRLLPVMVRDQSQTTAYALGRALARLATGTPDLAGGSLLLVASTDLSHFYPQNVAEMLDTEMLRQVESVDPAGVIRVEEAGRGFACGRGALAAVLSAARELGADRAQVLRHATSGDVTGDLDRVVGYAAAAVLRTRRN